ncbi:TonB-dependent receptor [Paraglaciecola aquimarina]|uniref:TonB-dependent receptor n=1 Tax=Paraglaciecola aquimarina TaxID=1235557 RepID=A0ABU3T1D3_9ALTE|nr:TonB-dependent receptor [Paraglaciecola aquimarina]MDU0356018.1 TonB-dependent receptor [Paraglaciecola aquimarina]
MEKEAITSAQQYRHNRGAFVEYQSELVSNLFITAGLRYDDNDDFGDYTTYRLSSAYIWPIGNNELKLRGAIGTGFRAPSLYEVEYNRGPWASSPASETELKQEETQGYELAVEYSTENGSHYEIVYFDQEIDDSIYFDLANFSGYLQDIGKSFSKRCGVDCFY